MTQQLRANTALTEDLNLEDLNLVPSTRDSSATLAPIPWNLSPSSGHREHLHSHMHPTHIHHICTS